MSAMAMMVKSVVTCNGGYRGWRHGNAVKTKSGAFLPSWHHDGIWPLRELNPGPQRSFCRGGEVVAQLGIEPMTTMPLVVV